MKPTFYERIGESVHREVLPNGLQVCVVPKPGYAKQYAFFATRYGGMDTRFCLWPLAGYTCRHRSLSRTQDVRYQGRQRPAGTG